MELNRIRLLSVDNLMKAIKDSGHEDIANILVGRGIDGKALLEFQELEAISWKLPRVQIKNLTTFIREVKQDPTLLTRGLPEPHVAPRRALPVPAKPHVVKLPIKTPIVSQIENSNSRFNKPPLELKLPISTPDIPPPPLIKPIETPKAEPIVPTARIKERPAFPLPRRVDSKPIEPPDDPKVDYGYLTPDDVGSQFPNFTEKAIPKQRVIPPSNSKVSKVLTTNSVQRKSVVDEDDEKPPALPPLRNRIESNKSPMGNRRLPAVPQGSPEIKRKSPSLEPPASRKFQQAASVEVEDEPDDNNIYDDVQEDQRHKKQELKVDTLQRTTSQPPIRKYSNGNSDNVSNSTLERDNQKRANFLGNLGKFLADKWTPPKTDTTGPSNYENHMLKSETTPITKTSFSFKDRPLPEIPKEYQPTYRRNSLKETETIPRNATASLSRKPKEKGFNQPNRNFPQRKNSEVKHVRDEHEDDDLVYENVKESNSRESDDFDAPEYENNESISKISKQNVLNKALLAHSLQRESTRPNESITTSRKQVEERSPINVPIDPEFENEEDGGVFYGNIDQPRSHPFTSKRPPLRGNVPSVGEDDADAPEYGNIDESDNSTNSSFPPERVLPTNRAKFNPAPSHGQTQITSRQSVPSLLALKLNEALKAREKKLQEKLNKSAPNKNNFAKIATPNDSDGDDNKPERNINVRKHTTEESSTNQGFYGNVTDSIRQELHEHRPVVAERQSNADLIFNINHEPFYRNTDRKGAKQLLRNFTDGAFLFRPSEKYFLVLTIKYNKKFYNLGIERTANNTIRLNADMSSISPEFETLKAFVEYFTKEAVTFSDQDTILEIYLNPVLPADIF